MARLPHLRLPIRTAFLSAAAALALTAPLTPASAELIYGVTNQNLLLSFDSATPGISAFVPITGLAPGASLLGIDIRPADGQLYGLAGFLGAVNSLYTINPLTGAATLVTPLSIPLPGTAAGMDFNPMTGQIRATTELGINASVDPVTGAVIPNPPLPSVVASAHTNNVAGAASTAVYGIDPNADFLLQLLNPDAGIPVPVGPLGIDATLLTGFDISGLSGTAFLATSSIASPFTSFYTVNLTTGAATLIGSVGSPFGPVSLTGIAAPVGITTAPVPEPGTWAMLLFGLGAVGMAFRRKRRSAGAAIA